jgi:hypothetical protein
VVEAGSCCGPPGDSAGTLQTPELLKRLADLLRRHDVNHYAASVKVYAVM